MKYITGSAELLHQPRLSECRPKTPGVRTADQPLHEGTWAAGYRVRGDLHHAHVTPDAATTLAAVVVGGSMSTGSTLVVERLRAGRDEGKEQGRRRGRLLLATRLVEDEIRSAIHLVELAAKSPEQAGALLLRVSSGEWQAQKRTLAELLGRADWDTVADAYQALTKVVIALDHERDSAPEGRSFSAQSLEVLWDQMNAARYVVGEEHGPKEVVRELERVARRRREIWPTTTP